MKLSRSWYYRPLNQPWEEKADENSPAMINVIIEGNTSKQVQDQPAESYSSEELQLKALFKIFSFYGKKPDHNALASIQDYHFFPRPSSRVILRYQYSAETLKGRPDLENVVAASGRDREDTVDPETGEPVIGAGHDPAYTVQLSAFTISKQLQSIKPMFDRYQAKLKLFNGQLRPFYSFSQQSNRLTLLVDRLKEFIKFNGYEYTDTEENKIYVTFNSSYDILFVEYNFRGITRPLTKGTEYFLSDGEGLNNRSTNQILANLPEVYDLRRNPPTWSEFIKSYSTGVEVDFFGPPSSETMSEWGTVYVENMARVLQTQYAINEERSMLILHAGQAMNEAQGQYEADTRAKLNELANGIRNMQDKAQIVEFYLNKFGINFLIEAALECAAHQAALDGAAFPPLEQIYRTLMGVDPYAELNKFVWQLPKFPMEMPVIGLFRPIGDAIAEAVEEALMEALVNFVEVLADFLLELCKGFDDDYGVAPLSSIAAQYPNPAEPGGGVACFFEKYAAFGISPELGNDFLEAISESITKRENCDLINRSADLSVLNHIKTIINDREDFAYLGEIFNDDQDHLINFFGSLGACISPDYCNSVYNVPPLSIPDLDPCIVEFEANIDPNILDELVNIYDNLDISELDLSCGGGLIPPFANMPVLMTVIIRLLNSLFDMPKTTFIGEAEGVKQAFVEPFPGDETNMTYFDAMMKEFDENPSHQDAPEGRGDAAFNKATSVRGIFSGLGLDAFLNNNLISSLGNNIDQARTNAIAYNMSTAVYRISQEYRDIMLNLLNELVTQYTNDPDVSLVSKLRKFWFRLPMSNTVPGSLYFSVGAPQNPHVGTVPDDMWLHEPGALPEGQDRDLLGVWFFNNIFHNLGAASGGFDAAASYNARDIVNKSVYFPALLSVLGSMSLAVANSKLFDYDEFGKLLLSPRPCVENNQISAGDLFDIQNIIDQSIEEFKQNSCADKGTFCVIGPVEDAVVFAVTNAILQILLLEQLLKNIFFIETYGLSQVIGNPEIISRIIAEVQENLEVGASPASMEYQHMLREAMSGVPGAFEAAQQMAVDLGSRTSTPISAPMVEAIRNGAQMYIKKLLFLSETGTELEDPFGGAPIIISDPENPGFKESIAYLVRKRLFDTMPAVSEIFGLGGGNFGKTFLLKGIPRVSLVDQSIAGVDHFERAQSAPESYPFDSVSAEVSSGQDASTSRPESDAGDTDANGIYTSLAVSDDSPSSTQPNPLQTLMDLGFPEGLQAQSVEHGLFGVEEYVEFYFNQETWDAFRENSDISGDAGERLRSLAWQRADRLLEETILPAHSRNGNGHYVTTYSVFEEFIRRISELASLYSEGVLDIFEGIEVTYLFGMPGSLNPNGKHDDPGEEPSWPTAKGPLTFDNYDAIRFWIKEVQKVSWHYNPDENHTAGSTSYSSMEYRQGLWKKEPLGVRMQHPAYQKLWTHNQVGGENRSNPDDRPWDMPNDQEKHEIYDMFYPYNIFDTDWDDRFASEPATGFVDENKPGSPPPTMLQWYNTEWVAAALIAVNDPNFYDYSRSERRARAHEYSLHNNRCNDARFWDPYNNDNSFDQLWTNHPEYLNTDGGKGRWRGAEGLIASADTWNFSSQDLQSNIDRFAVSHDDDWLTYVRKQRAEYLDDLNYTDFSGMSIPIETDRSYNRINMLVYGACRAPSNFPISDTRFFKYIYQPHPYDLYGGIPFDRITNSQWEKIRDQIDPESFEGLINGLKYLHSQGNYDQLDPGHHLGWIHELFSTYTWNDSFNPVAFLSNRQLYDLLELYTRTPNGRPARELLGPQQVDVGPYYSPSLYNNSFSVVGMPEGWFGLERPWMAETGQSSRLMNFNKRAGDFGAVVAIYVSNIEEFNKLANISSIELRALFDYYDPSNSTDTEENPDSALTLLGDTISNVQSGARVVYYSPVITPVRGRPAMEELRNNVVDLLDKRTIEQQEADFFQSRKNFILQLGGGTLAWATAMGAFDTATLATEQFVDSASYVVNIGTKINEKTTVYYTDPQSEADPIALDSLDALANFTGGAYLALRQSFGASRNALYDAMANSTAFNELFNNAINVTDLASFIYLAGINSSDSVVSTHNNISSETRSEKISKIFSDTKLSLVTILKGALVGESYTMGGGRTASDAARDAALGLMESNVAQQVGQMGASFILKMLIETPIKILKGLAELVDPNIFVGVKIREITGMIMSEIAGKSGMISEDEIADLLNDIAIPRLFPPIDPGAPVVSAALTPVAHSTGLDVIGKWPFLLVPPPGPLGIIYILLKLAEMDLVPPFPAPDCSNLLGPPDPDAPTDQLPVPLLTTYGCPDEEEN